MKMLGYFRIVIQYGIFYFMTVLVCKDNFSFALDMYQIYLISLVLCLPFYMNYYESKILFILFRRVDIKENYFFMDKIISPGYLFLSTAICLGFPIENYFLFWGLFVFGMIATLDLSGGFEKFIWEHKTKRFYDFSNDALVQKHNLKPFLTQFYLFIFLLPVFSRGMMLLYKIAIPA